MKSKKKRKLAETQHQAGRCLELGDSRVRDTQENGARAAKRHVPLADATTANNNTMLHKKILKLTKKIGKATKPEKKAVLQAKLLQRLEALADQENQSEHATPAEDALPPQRTVPSSTRLSAIIAAKTTVGDTAKRCARAERFSLDVSEPPDEEIKLVEARQQGQLWGTSTQLEKEYLRLTSLPPASSVRPPAVLRDALKLVKRRWAQEVDYRWAWQQLKAIRQDLTVQHVEDALAVDAYETHARIAIEVADWAEFQQCQSVLQRLYKKGAWGSEAEFTAYAVLHAASHGGAILHRELVRLPVEMLQSSSIQHAIAVIRAYRSGDYAELMRLYGEAPRMSPYLMDILLARLRPWTLKCLVTAYHPQQLPINFAAEQLGMEDVPQAIEYCEGHGAVVDHKACALDTKASRSRPAGPSAA